MSQTQSVCILLLIYAHLTYFNLFQIFVDTAPLHDIFYKYLNKHLKYCCDTQLIFASDIHIDLLTSSNLIFTSVFRYD